MTSSRSRIGHGLIVVGHIISSVGCRLKGEHIPSKEFPWYCLMCGRRVRAESNMQGHSRDWWLGMDDGAMPPKSSESTEDSEWEQLESSLHAHYRNLKTGEVLSGMQCLERLNTLQAKARQVDALEAEVKRCIGGECEWAEMYRQKGIGPEHDYIKAAADVLVRKLPEAQLAKRAVDAEAKVDALVKALESSGEDLSQISVAAMIVEPDDVSSEIIMVAMRARERIRVALAALQGGEVEPGESGTLPPVT